jgi:hypothetical protein
VTDLFALNLFMLKVAGEGIGRGQIGNAASMATQVVVGTGPSWNFRWINVWRSFRCFDYGWGPPPNGSGKCRGTKARRRGAGFPSRASRPETAGIGTPELSAARIRSSQGVIWRASPSGAKALA